MAKKLTSAQKRKRLEKKLDNLWSKIIRSKNVCEHCGKSPPEIKLNSHHVFRRSKRSTRWDLNNGICLCFWCHSGLAHGKHYEEQKRFHDWVEEYKGSDTLDELRRKSHNMKKLTLDDMENILTALQSYSTSLDF